MVSLSGHVNAQVSAIRDGKSGWPHSSRDQIPCVFPEFSLCYEFFPCVFSHKLIDGFE